jgi:hypothetical protein
VVMLGPHNSRSISSRCRYSEYNFRQSICLAYSPSHRSFQFYILKSVEPCTGSSFLCPMLLSIVRLNVLSQLKGVQDIHVSFPSRHISTSLTSNIISVVSSIQSLTRSNYQNLGRDNRHKHTLESSQLTQTCFWRHAILAYDPITAVPIP